MRNFCLILCALITFSACDIVAQNASETRLVNNFTKIKVKSGINLFLIPSSEEEVRIEARGYHLSDVITEVVDNELRIYRDNWSFTMGSVNVYVKCKNLTSVEASGGSDVIGEETLRSDEFYVKASGGSDVRLSVHTHYLEANVSGGADFIVNGTADVVRLSASGGSDIKASNLQAQRGVVKVSGGADANVFITDEIDISASGGADVSVKGNPQIRNVKNDVSSDVTIR